MEERKAANNEELENSKPEQKLNEDKLEQVSGGGVVLRPSSDLRPIQPGNGELI